MVPPRDGAFDEDAVVRRFRRAWSAESSSLWSEENPARGHCGVTALIVQDHFGGEIRKTPVDGESHFYNYIDGQRHDLTAEQFDEPPVYLDRPSSREKAFTDTNSHQYEALSERFLDVFSEGRK